MIVDQLLAAARAAASPEELCELAIKAGRTLSIEESKKLFTRLHSGSGEVSDEELAAVAGGGCGGGPRWVEPTDSCRYYRCDGCGSGKGGHAADCSQVRLYPAKLDKCFTCDCYEIGGYCTSGHRGI